MSPYHSNAPLSAKSWRAPLVILSALLAGLGFAIAHHLLGEHLDGRPVVDIPVSQAWVSRISTALAFLVKVALAVSVGTAYVQHQWLRFHKQSFKTKDVDALTGVLGNALSFVGSHMWLRHPLLTLMALISWSIPIATITAPGSLTVSPLSFNETFMDYNVPQLQFDNMTNYGDTIIGESDVAVRPLINKLAIRAASAAEPVPIASSHLNESYHREFYAPAVRCSISANTSRVRNISIEMGEQDSGGSGMDFLSWAGREEDFPLGDLTLTPLDVLSTDGSRVFVVTSEGTSNTTYNYTSSSQGDTQAPQRSVVECVLHNASYSVRSAFRYPSQTHEVNILRWLDPMSAAALGDVSQERLHQFVSYLTVMSSFGKLLVGSGYWTHYGGSGSYVSSWAILDIDWADRDLIPQQLERLFQNITLSLLSDSGLIKNSTFAEPVNITVNNWKVTYVYTKSDLLLAYGISILCTFICALVGFYAFFVNDGSYQNIFSTFLRATNDIEIRLHIVSGDTGSDPLPNTLASTAVMLSGLKAGGGMICPAVGTAKSDDLELQHLRPVGSETPMDHGSSFIRESLDCTPAVHDLDLPIPGTVDH